MTSSIASLTCWPLPKAPPAATRISTGLPSRFFTPSTMTCFAAMAIAGGTLAIDGLSGDAMSEAGGKGRQAADTHSGCTAGQDRANDNVVDFSRINIRAGGGVTQGMAHQDGDLTLLREPRWALPMGVRAEETRTASCIPFPSHDARRQTMRSFLELVKRDVA